MRKDFYFNVTTWDGYKFRMKVSFTWLYEDYTTFSSHKTVFAVTRYEKVNSGYSNLKTEYRSYSPDCGKTTVVPTWEHALDFLTLYSDMKIEKMSCRKVND